jgi:hypothetical protein
MLSNFRGLINSPLLLDLTERSKLSVVFTYKDGNILTQLSVSALSLSWQVRVQGHNWVQWVRRNFILCL